MKPVCILQAPVATRSGYGDMARDIAWHLIDLNLFDLKIVSLPWGGCPINALSVTSPRDVEILSKIATGPIQLQAKPDLFIHVTIPNEFQAPAKINIGITAGIETNMCSEQWVEGSNRMTSVWGISNHAVSSIKDTTIQKHDPNGNVISTIQANIPFEVMPNCVHTDIFKKIPPSEIDEKINEIMYDVKESFGFLFVGHWIKGGLGEDRKNIGILIRTFCETFKGLPSATRPALVLKTSGASFSILDREDILSKIRHVKNMVGAGCPNVYLIHGDLTTSQMNSLYNHPKIKAHISFTKGEGFGRPLLEASMSEKPIIASGWSGQLDFLNPKDAILLPGELRQIEGGAVWDNILIPQSSWFNVDEKFASRALMIVFRDYDRFLPGAKKLAKENAEKFNYEVTKNKFEELLKKYVPENVLTPPKLIKLNMPSLKLPTLKKVGEPVNA